MKPYTLVSLFLLAGCASWADTLLYSNVTNNTGFTDSFIQNGLVEAGDQITLNTPNSFFAAQTAETSLFNSAGDGGTADVTLRLYAVDALNNLGPLLLSSTLVGFNIAADTSAPLTFANLNTIVPSTLVWTLSYTTTDPIALELEAFDPPTVGSSDNTTVWWDTGSGLTLTSPGFDTENYNFQLSGADVPEPGCLILTIFGIAGLSAGRLRRPIRR